MIFLNFHEEEKIDWESITRQVEELPCKDICERGDTMEIIESLLNSLNEVCTENVPRRNGEEKERVVPKEIRILRNKIKCLKRTKRSARSNEKKKCIDNAILETERELIKTRQKRKQESERGAIESLKR